MNPLRILISYSFGHNSIPLGYSCARALKELGCEVYCFDSGIKCYIDNFILRPLTKALKVFGLANVDLTKKTRWGAQNYKQRLLEKAVAEFRPDVLFMIRGDSFDRDFLKMLRRKHEIQKLVGWWTEGPKWFDALKADASVYDKYFCIHKEGYTAADNIEYFTALAVDNHLYRKILPVSQAPLDIVFVGVWNEQRQKVIESISDFPVSIYGPKWKAKNVFNPSIRRMIKKKTIWGEDLVKLYNNSKIGLNITSWNEKKLSGLNMRVFDIPACGTFLLTDYSEELEEFFQIGHDIEVYRDLEELRDKLKFYLKNDTARARVAANGYDKVCQLPKFQDRMKDWLTKIQS